MFDSRTLCWPFQVQKQCNIVQYVTEMWICSQISLKSEPFNDCAVVAPMNHESIHQMTSSLAYLDGGSGSLIFQMVIASSVTAIYAAKTQWSNLVAAVSKIRNRNTKPSGL